MNDILLLLCGLLFLSGCGEIKVTATVIAENTNGSEIEAARLSLTRGNLEAVNSSRLKIFDGRPADEVLEDIAAQLKIDISGNPEELPEAYHFLAIHTAKNALSGGTSDDRAYMENHLGNLIYLNVRQGNLTEEVIVSGENHLGAAWLAIVQDNDRVVPWNIPAGAANCDPPGDCTDIERITREIFNTLANAIEAGIPGSIPFSTVRNHRLHFVPRVRHPGLDEMDKRARGFGLIYYTRIDVPGITFDVYVPIDILFVKGISNYEIWIDPMSFPDDFAAPAQNLDRIYVRGSGIGSVAEATIRDGIRDAIAAATLPEIIPGVAFEEALLSAIGTAAGLPPKFGSPPVINQQFEVIAMPELDVQKTFPTMIWQRNPGLANKELGPIRLVFLE